MSDRTAIAAWDMHLSEPPEEKVVGECYYGHELYEGEEVWDTPDGYVCKEEVEDYLREQGIKKITLGE